MTRAPFSGVFMKRKPTGGASVLSRSDLAVRLRWISVRTMPGSTLFTMTQGLRRRARPSATRTQSNPRVPTYRPSGSRASCTTSRMAYRVSALEMP